MLKGKKALTDRPGSYLKDTDGQAERRKAQEATGLDIDDRRLASYLMYPKVFTDFAKTQDKYGPTEALPTPVYFYGLKEGEELFVEIEKGKTLVVQYLGRAETNEKGEVRVFFYINGQPRTITVPESLQGRRDRAARQGGAGRSQAVRRPHARRHLIGGDQQGQKVTAGDALC